MNKGQIFSIDLLFASIIAILLIGVLINVIEIKNYEQKDSILQTDFDLSSEAALNVLLNGKYSCEFNNINISNSIDRGKLHNSTIEELSKELGLIDKNFEIWTIDTLSNSPIKSKGIIGENANVYEIDFLDCEFIGETDTRIFENLNNLIKTNTTQEIAQKNTLLFKVSK